MIDFDSVCAIRNRNEYSTKLYSTLLYKLCHFNLTMYPLYLVKLKIAQK